MRKGLLALIIMFAYAGACAQEQITESENANGKESRQPQKSLTEETSPLGHFSWGVDAYSAIDLTGEDMTFTGIGAHFGYKGDYIRILGIGAAINTMMSNRSVSYPVYAILQTNFRKAPSLCFLSLKGGLSFNRIYNYSNQTGGYGNVGFGINLAQGKTFRSHIVVGYTFLTRRDFEAENEIHKCPTLHFASFGIGILF